MTILTGALPGVENHLHDVSSLEFQSIFHCLPYLQEGTRKHFCSDIRTEKTSPEGHSLWGILMPAAPVVFLELQKHCRYDTTVGHDILTYSYLMQFLASNCLPNLGSEGEPKITHDIMRTNFIRIPIKVGILTFIFTQIENPSNRHQQPVHNNHCTPAA